MTRWFFHILGMSSSQLTLTPSFFRRVGIPSTSIDHSCFGIPLLKWQLRVFVMHWFGVLTAFLALKQYIWHSRFARNWMPSIWGDCAEVSNFQLRRQAHTTNSRVYEPLKLHSPITLPRQLNVSHENWARLAGYILHAARPAPLRQVSYPDSAELAEPVNIGKRRQAVGLFGATALRRG